MWYIGCLTILVIKTVNMYKTSDMKKNAAAFIIKMIKLDVDIISS